MKLAIVGSRSFSDYELLKESVLRSFPNVSLIVSGGAKGADKLGEKLADELGLKTEIYLPDWARYGKGAGLVRNELIIKNSEGVIAFWDGLSKGTKKSIEISRTLKKKIVVVKV